MKFLGRMLWLLLGLIWRLVVLLLFEKWVPFPDRPQQAPPAEPRRARGSKKQRKQPPPGREPPATPPSPFERERAQRARQRLADQERVPFFTAQSSELSPELAALREGEHWLPARKQAPRVRRMTSQREGLAGLLRDKRALRDAIVLGAALGPRRTKL